MSIASRIVAAACALWTIAGPAGAATPAGPRPPERLSETGLYAEIGAGRVDPRNRPYAPQYPLWTDGAAKRRWVYLPPGAPIDTSDPDAWDFSAGTRFWKEFAFGDRPVETRMMWKADAATWVFATYVWNDQATDATLAPEQGIPDLVEIAQGKRHGIPGVFDCRACHDSARTEVLGFSALQLSTDRDPAAPHAEPLADGMVTLRTLVDENRLGPKGEEWLADPPRIRADTPRARAALGYLSANCGSCHNPRNPIADLGLMLAHSANAEASVEPGLATTVGVAGEWDLPGRAPGQSLRIDPGHPEASSVLVRLASRSPASQMPPLGSVVVDREAVELVRAWIAEDLSRRED